jgi:BASS family bile acid:Na+ symporter
VVLGTLWAWFAPGHFTWFVDGSVTVLGAKLISVGLGVIMFGMGITLEVSDFRRVLAVPWSVALGVAAQFVVMPMLGITLAWAFGLEAGLAVGLVLVSCCPGGTASNVVTYLAGANLPLSVLMTMVSTALSVGLTPLLTGWLAGKYVEVDEWNLLVNMLAVVLVPVAAGVFLNRLAPRLVRYVTPWSPLLSVLVVVLIVGGIVGASKGAIAQHAGVLLAAVVSLHAGGFGLGYLVAKAFGMTPRDRQTVSIEVGMQNSGLGSALAKTDKFQAQFPTPAEAALAPVPSAVSALVHCLIGSALAAYWRARRECP